MPVSGSASRDHILEVLSERSELRRSWTRLHFSHNLIHMHSISYENITLKNDMVKNAGGRTGA